MKPSMPTCELMSALADGQLAGDDLAAALQACQQGDSALASWDTYHLIGDVLRSPAPVVQVADRGFLDRLNQRLKHEEPLVGAPHAPVASVDLDAATQANAKPVSDLIHHRGPASNDGNFRWKLVAGFASLAAVAAIAWNASGLLAPVTAPPQLAQVAQVAQVSVPQQVLVASPQGPMVRDARLEELLAAHKQLGGASALQVPSGFLRNATFETPQNAGR
ncbi:sigma-E factor negative regulatory protein [Polaromonas sp. P1(28)-13]|nr:sigma-E factor negative regulatory protein [Polaromonas sp. P1(28)-13]